MSIPSTLATVTPRVSTAGDLGPDTLNALRRMLEAAYAGDFTDLDWAHALGGTHVWIQGDTGPISHAAVVPRTLITGGDACRVGYVEAVATAAPFRRCGHATSVMQRVNDLVRSQYALGVLSTGEHGFYERLGWLRWRGPSFVMTAAGRQRTPDDDDGLMVLIPDASRRWNLDGELVADWREGDVW